MLHPQISLSGLYYLVWVAPIFRQAWFVVSSKELLFWLVRPYSIFSKFNFCILVHLCYGFQASILTVCRFDGVDFLRFWMQTLAGCRSTIIESLLTSISACCKSSWIYYIRVIYKVHFSLISFSGRSLNFLVSFTIVLWLVSFIYHYEWFFFSHLQNTNNGSIRGNWHV